MNSNNLQQLAKLVRYYSLYSTTQAGSGHPTTSLSAADLMTVLFFKHLRFDLDHPDNPANDRVIFSKGHGSPLLYALYAAAGVVSKEELAQLRTFDSPLEGHPTPRFPYTEAATGSLGQGLSVGFGMALALRVLVSHQMSPSVTSDEDSLRLVSTSDESSATSDVNSHNVLPHVYVLLGDGEMAEGSVWEAIQLAAHYKLNNLVGILDVNRLAQSDATMYGHDMDAYAQRIGSFGWNTMVIDGHDIGEIDDAFGSLFTSDESSATSDVSSPEDSRPEDSQPTMIIAKTVKGRGVSFVEDRDGWHGKALKQDEFEKAVAELGEIDEQLRGKIRKPTQDSKLPAERDPAPQDKTQNYNAKLKASNAQYKIQVIPYKKGDEVATRKVYGEVLANLGKHHTNIVALDADVKNSTYSQTFKDAHEGRFFDMYIAEQNMVGAAVGMARLGLVPFASTFACFLTRAYDQIRMAAISASNIKLIGSHAGVSIGEDGASQMALEDFAMMRAVHGSTVLHGSDAVSTAKLLEQMVDCPGIAYMRTNRPTTPVLYAADEEFPLGGSKVVRSSNADKVTIVGVGITVHEAITAAEQLKSDGIAVRVIDCYSIKPIDRETLVQAASETQAIVTVEDHWNEGGLGEAVLSALADADNRPPVHKLAVGKMPRSGTPDELRDYEGISSGAIVQKVKEILG